MNHPYRYYAKTYSFILAIFVTVTAAQDASADLVLHVDTNSKEFFFSGTETGKVGDFSYMTWRGGIVNGTPTNVNVSSGFDSVPGATFQLRNMGVQLSVYFTDEELHTFSGNSVKFSYAGESQSKIDALEGLIGTNLETAFNTTGSPISVEQFSSVPEPTTFGVLGIGVLGLGLIRRRRI